MLPTTRRRSRRLRRPFSCSPKELLNRLFISWEIRRFNEFLYLWGQRHSRILRPLFSVGVGFGLSMMMVVFMMLVWAFSLIVKFGISKESGPPQESSQLVTFVVPGLNVPWSDLPYIVFATAFAVGFHELGHAVAATSEGVPVEYVAVFLACLIPGALIALDDEALQLLSPVRALRIYCAGVWHNGLCCAGCLMLLSLLPIVLSPWFLHSENPLVLAVESKSHLAGHLSPGDRILQVSGQEVQNPEHWVESLLAVRAQELPDVDTRETFENKGQDSLKVAEQGFCFPVESIRKEGAKVSGTECLNDELLFYEHPCTSYQEKGAPNKSHHTFCLKAGDIVKYPPCRPQNSNVCGCKGVGDSTFLISSLKGNHKLGIADCLISDFWLQIGACFLSVVNHGESFVTVKFHQADRCTSDVLKGSNSSDGACPQTLIYVGDPVELIHGLILSKYWPRPNSLFANLYFWRWFPNLLQKLLSYTFSISAAMVVLNSAPVLYLDGEAILQAGISLSKPCIPLRARKRLMQIVLVIASALFGLSLVAKFFETFYR